MKKIFGIALALVLSVCLICAIAVNASAAVVFTASNASGIAGSEVDVNVAISENTGFGVLQIEVKFDHTKVQLVSFNKNIPLPEDYSDIGVNGTVNKANTTGSIKIKWEPDLIEEGVFSTPLTFEGNALTLKFQILDTNAVGTEIPVSLTIKDCYMDDMDMTDVANTVVNGKITVIACDHAANTNPLTETKTPNCTEEGEKSANCSVCGNLITEPIPVVADAHDWGEYTETTPGNCTTPAVLTRVCSHNPTHTETKDGEIVATNHDFGAWTEVTPGNCTTPAVEKRVCSRDANHYETRNGSTVADNHAWGNWTEVTPGNCTTPSVEKRVCANDPNHFETRNGSTVADNHAWGAWTEVTPGDCTTPSVEKRVCANDPNHFETRNGSTVADDHDWGAWTEVTPGNCSTPSVEKRVCANDPNHFETRNGSIVADNHDWGTWTEVTPGNCSTPSVEKRVCSHDASHFETRNGSIVADNHAWGNWSPISAGDCVTPPQEERVCAHNENHKETRDGTINPDLHDWNDWSVTTPPTADTEGERTRVCANDPNHVETQTLAKLGSTFNSDDESASIKLDDTSLVPTDAKLDVVNALETGDPDDIADFAAAVKEKTGKDLADFYGYGLIKNDMLVDIDKATISVKVPVNDGFNNLKYYAVDMTTGDFVDVSDKIVDGTLTYDVEDVGTLFLVAAGDKVVTPGPGNVDKNPENGDNAAIPYILVATMMAAAAAMVIFKKKANA